MKTRGFKLMFKTVVTDLLSNNLIDYAYTIRCLIFKLKLQYVLIQYTMYKLIKIISSRYFRF